MASDVADKIETAGVWETDAPAGYVALVVRSSRGKQMLRVEIAQEWYSITWVAWLTKWLRRWDRYGLRVLP